MDVRSVSSPTIVMTATIVITLLSLYEAYLSCFLSCAFPTAGVLSCSVLALHHAAQVLGEHSLQLQQNERLLSVAWQNTSSSAPLEPYQCAAAILTTQVHPSNLGHVFAAHR